MSASSSTSLHPSRSKKFRAATALVGLVSFAYAVPAAWAFPWDTDMYRGATVRPLTVAPRVMPEGTLPIAKDGELSELPMTRQQMTASEHNPVALNPENLAAGKNLYVTNCAPCHGAGGRGDGPVVHLLRTKPSDLITGVSKDLPDGYLYGTIRDGGIAMPSYADAMSASERWQLVMFVRTMQRAGLASK